jgi:hypothetical protein
VEAMKGSSSGSPGRLHGRHQPWWPAPPHRLSFSSSDCNAYVERRRQSPWCIFIFLVIFDPLGTFDHGHDVCVDVRAGSCMASDRLNSAYGNVECRVVIDHDTLETLDGTSYDVLSSVC